MPPDHLSTLAANLRQHVDRLAGLIGPRHLGKPQSIIAAATLIERELTQSGYTVEHQTYEASGHPVSNLIAELPATTSPDTRHSPTRHSSEIIVLGAHYDTVYSTPGADDNASAVAVLLEAARLLKNCQPRRTIRFVAFACEEMPYFHTGQMGSQVYARMCKARGDNILGMLCLEMVGYYSDAPHSQQRPPTIPKFLHRAFPHRGNFLAAVGNLRSWKLNWQFRRGFKRTVKFPLFSICLPEAVHEIRLSDNSSFWDQGYPALMLTDTSFLRNPHYHEPTDTPDTLDYDRMASVTLGVVGGVAKLARAKLLPTF